MLANNILRLTLITLHFATCMQANILILKSTSSSAVAERSCDALCQYRKHSLLLL